MNPLLYILKDSWRKRSRTIFSMAGIASLSFLFILFTSMDRGLEEYFEDDIGEPTEEAKALHKLYTVLDKWVFLISALCWTLMVLVIANTSIIMVVERRVELATLRALGIKSIQVSLLVAGTMGIILYSGLIAGTALGALSVPLLDSVEFAFWGSGVGFPLSLDTNTLLLTFSIGTLAGLVGLIPPVVIINRLKPAEVLRDG